MNDSPKDVNAIIKSKKLSRRKDEHIELCLSSDIQYKSLLTGLEEIKLSPNLLLDYSFTDIDLSSSMLKKPLAAPLIVSGMTGGTNKGKDINQTIAKVCNKIGIAMGVGSQRVALENKNLAHTFDVRQLAPDIPLFGNLGIVQCKNFERTNVLEEAIQMINADALALHVNPLQEFVQKEGKYDQFSIKLLLRKIVEENNFPMIIKGVGMGLNKKDAEYIVKLNPYAIDVAGAGGTNWTKIEFLRNKEARYFSEQLLEWGISTKQSIINTLEAKKDIQKQTNTLVIASGGVWSGMDAIKSLLLGADYVGFALPALRAVMKGEEELVLFLETFLKEMKIVMAMLNVKNIKELKMKREKILPFL